VAVIVVGAVLAAVAVFGTVVLVVVPAGTVHGVTALNDYLVTSLERLLAEVTGGMDGGSAYSHAVAGIAHDILMQEVAITEVRYDKLEQQPHGKDNNESQQQTVDEDDGKTGTVDDDGIVDAALVDGCRERRDEAVGTAVGETYSEQLVVATVDLAVGILESELIGVGTDIESL
jgi:hypothetical protein